MTLLRDMRNIGAVTAMELEASGVADGETLRALGSVGAAFRLRQAGFEVCRSKLAGFEGAIRDVKWNLVPRDEREALWRRLEEMSGR
jgi:hypothetical protein